MIRSPRRSPLSRWPLLALLVGSLLASALTLVPARADALESNGFCSAAGFILCYRVEIGEGPYGPEFRMFYNPWNLQPWVF